MDNDIFDFIVRTERFNRRKKGLLKLFFDRIDDDDTIAGLNEIGIVA